MYPKYFDIFSETNSTFPWLLSTKKNPSKNWKKKEKNMRLVSAANISVNPHLSQEKEERKLNKSDG